MRVVALQRFEYANKLRLPGDEFDTDTDEHARLLALVQRVEIAPDIISTRALKADSGKQRYRHRAMRADE